MELSGEGRVCSVSMVCYYFRLTVGPAGRIPAGASSSQPGLLLVGPAPANVHLSLPLDADLFLTHLTADLLGFLNGPLTDRDLFLDHGLLHHRDLLLADRDADLLAGRDV